MENTRKPPIPHKSRVENIRQKSLIKREDRGNHGNTNAQKERANSLKTLKTK
jgi:hypothetical protein